MLPNTQALAELFLSQNGSYWAGLQKSRHGYGEAATAGASAMEGVSIPIRRKSIHPEVRPASQWLRVIIQELMATMLQPTRMAFLKYRFSARSAISAWRSQCRVLAFK
jgi:hypothetical protein